MTEHEMSLQSACAPVVCAISLICGVALLCVAAIVMMGVI